MQFNHRQITAFVIRLEVISMYTPAPPFLHPHVSYIPSTAHTLLYGYCSFQAGSKAEERTKELPFQSLTHPFSLLSLRVCIKNNIWAVSSNSGHMCYSS